MFKSRKGVVWLVLEAFISCCNNWGSLKIISSGGVGFLVSLVSLLVCWLARTAFSFIVGFLVFCSLCLAPCQVNKQRYDGRMI